MKVLKGRLHIDFGDLIIGDTFVFDGRPCIKVGGSAGAVKEKVLECIKNDPNYLNGVCLESGTLYHYPKDKRVEKVDLGVTGIDAIDD
ncbi:hypothetical protein LCGC14_2766950 [marine sediment metagenome]|uniref:Uncharacterized protein n=1 Tax=marine sediment metagenome TaxID=412755 RepID=A0A0F9BNY1_9ZZZZ